MIAIEIVHSNIARSHIHRRHAVLLGSTALLTACVPLAAPPGPTIMPPNLAADAFLMPDGARLPYRAWLPAGKPEAVVLALHGFNDSRDAFEIPGPEFAAAGMAVYAPDQRGFGEAPGRGLWAGGEAMVDDAAAMATLLRRRHQGAKLVLMGESMGGAILMRLAARGDGPDDAAYVLLAPAVWGRARMNAFLRSALWLTATFTPGMNLTRPPPTIKIYASDNNDALIRLSRDPLTLRSTRADTLRGLVDLMDSALAAAPDIRTRALFLYGANDQLVPKAATLATWRALATPPAQCAYYPSGWHLLLRDLGRAAPIGDVIAWINNGASSLPSGGDAHALEFLSKTG